MKTLRNILGAMGATIYWIVAVLIAAAGKAVLTDEQLGPYVIFWGIVSIPVLIGIHGVVTFRRNRAAELAAQELARQQYQPPPEPVAWQQLPDHQLTPEQLYWRWNGWK